MDTPASGVDDGDWLLGEDGLWREDGVLTGEAPSQCTLEDESHLGIAIVIGAAEGGVLIGEALAEGSLDLCLEGQHAHVLVLFLADGVALLLQCPTLEAVEAGVVL